MRAAASDFAADLLDVYKYLERMDEIGLPRLAFVGSRLRAGRMSRTWTCSSRSELSDGLCGSASVVPAC